MPYSLRLRHTWRGRWRGSRAGEWLWRETVLLWSVVRIFLVILPVRSLQSPGGRWVRRMLHVWWRESRTEAGGGTGRAIGPPSDSQTRENRWGAAAASLGAVCAAPIVGWVGGSRSAGTRE